MTLIRLTYWERYSTPVLLVAGLSVTAIGLIALFGWILDMPALNTWKADTQPMPPSTAVLSVLFGTVLCLVARTPKGRVAKLLATFLSWAGTITCLILFPLRALGMRLSAEQFGLHISGTFGSFPIGYISPVSSFCFLLAFGALLAELSTEAPDSLASWRVRAHLPLCKRGIEGDLSNQISPNPSFPKRGTERLPWRRWLVWSCAGVILLTGFLFLLAYAFGAPILAGNVMIVPAFNTTLILMIMGLALLVLAARHTRQPDMSSTPIIKTSPYIMVFIVFTAVILANAYNHYRRTEVQFRREMESQLLAVSALKSGELIRWRQERLGDGALFQSTSITAAVRRLLETPGSLSAQQELQDWLGRYLKHYGDFGYDQIFVLDTKGIPVLTVPDKIPPPADRLIEQATAYLGGGQIVFQDFYRDEHDQHVYLGMIVPILDRQAGNQPLGTIVLRINPSIFLYPFLQNWPVPSTSAETLLVRRDGNEVLFLNDLRFFVNAALNLRIPLSDNENPAVKAVLGQQGMVDGIDYRGIPVIAAVRDITDSPWYLVTLMDTAEVYAPLKEKLWLTLLLTGLLELGIGGGLFYLWHRQLTVLKQGQIESALALQEKDERHSVILQTIMDGFLLLDSQGQVLEVNETYCRMSGYSEQALLAMHISDLEALETNAATLAHIQAIKTQGEGRFESRHYRSDGSDYDVEVSVQYRAVEGGQFMVFVRNISERKQSEEKLYLAASVFTHALEGIMITNKEGMIIKVNDAFCQITGFSRDEILGQNPRFFSAGRQGKDFYATMRYDLKHKGLWNGEVWNRRKNGEVYAVMQNISAVRDTQGITRHYVALISDITLLKEHQQELERVAHYDALTGLPNRVLMIDRLHQAIAQARRREQLMAVVFLDLDGFKAVNDNYGHLAGDQLLISVANNMKQTLREIDTLARMGGDEFVVILVDIGDIETSAPVLTRLLAAASQPEPFGDNILNVSASLGVTFYPQKDAVDADLLIRQADQAMYQAKITGKNRYHIFDVAQSNFARTHHESLKHIHSALAAGEFVLYYQPKVNLRLGHIIGAEALIRWQHPDKGLLGPDTFLPLIEDHPLSIDIGEWVIDTALSQIEHWHTMGLNIPVSVNVGACQLQQENFIESLRTLLAAHPAIKWGDLELEIIETSAMKDLNKVSLLIAACRELGIKFAIDDFGTGYSSLTYLRRLPVNQIKIDQSFVRNMLNDTDDLAIVEGVLALAATFNLEVIAEGMETIKQGEMLLQLGCDLAQGYGIAHPMPAADIPNWVSTWRPDPGWVDRPSFTRDNLPLLFAGAEHRIWLSTLENHLKNEHKASPPDNQHCRFGAWLNNENLTQHVGGATFQAIVPLHQQVHRLATELLDLHAHGQNRKALARLEALHTLQDALLKQLEVLVQENWK